jgi:hypothetical protein
MKAIRFVLLLPGLLLLCCNNPGPVSTGSEDGTAVAGWPALLEKLDLGSGAVLVTPDGSLQEAIRESRNGEVVLVAPGTHRGPFASEGSEVPVVLLPAGDGSEAKVRQAGDIRPLSLQGLPAGKALDRFSMERMDLGGGIAHYIIHLPLGPGTYDVVRLHRVVKEEEAYQPVRTMGNVFMVHGAVQDFEDIFLVGGAGEINGGTSSPYYLAEKGIDVWGLDLAWNLVPLECEDFAFMEGWGVDHDIDHCLKAMSVARLVRGLTGQGYGKINLLGFSYGVALAYGGAGLETQLAPICRDISGIIPVDSEFKFGPEEEAQRLENCAEAAATLAELEQGVYEFPWGTQFHALAGLALNDPDGPSPIPDFSGMTNSQATLAVLTMTSPHWHFLGGTLEGLLYTDFQRFLRMGVAITPYMPKQTAYEYSACHCDSAAYEVAFDDHLEDIAVPIFYLGAGGGARSGNWVARNRTASKDVHSHIVSIEGAGQAVDYGHADLWLGKDAATLVWSELYTWLVNRE